MTNKSKSLSNLFLVYSVGNIATRMINFLLIFVTTFYLTKEEVGQYDLILITISLLTPLATLQITDSALRWLLEDHSVDRLKNIISNVGVILLTGFIFLAIVMGIVNIFYPIQYFLKIYVLIFFQSVFLLNQQYLRGIGDNKMYVLSGILYTFLYALLTYISLSILKLKVEGVVMANIIAIIIINAFILINNKLYQYFESAKVSINLMKELLSYSIPLVPNSLSWWAISSFNRFVILKFLGIGANGIFAISYKIPTIVLVFINIFNFSWQEKAITSQSDKNRDAYFTTTLKKYITILFSLAIMVVAINRLLLKYIVSADFQDSWQYTPILLLGVVFNSLSTFYGSIYLGERKTHLLLYSSIFGGGVTVALGFLMVPIFGLYGASFAIFLGYFSLFIVRINGLNKQIKVKIDWMYFTVLMALYLGFAGLSFIEPILYQVGSIFLATCLVLFLNREMILTKLLKR